MHPVLIATFIINVILARTVFGFIGLFGALVGSGVVYFFISKDGRDTSKYWGQVAAIGFGHLFGFIALANAPWTNPLLTGFGFIINLFVVAIFSALGKR